MRSKKIDATTRIFIATIAIIALVGLFVWQNKEDITNYIIGKESSVSSVTPKIETNIGKPSENEKQIQVHFINVGQADCELIIDGDHAALIDAGNAEDAEIILNYLKAYNVSHLDYAIFTHPHEDHIGSAAQILNEISTDIVFEAPVGNTTQVYKNMQKVISEKGYIAIYPEVGDTYTFGNGEFIILGPDRTLDFSDINNASIVFKYTYENTAFLFQGDAERESEAAILEDGTDVSADVYKVGHHGSNSSTSYPWLRAIMPKIAVICVDANSKLGMQYGHPTDDTLSKLRDANVPVYRTDLNGNIVVSSDGENVWATTEL